MNRTSAALGIALCIVATAAPAAADEEAKTAPTPATAEPKPAEADAPSGEAANVEETKVMLRVDSPRIVAVENVDTGEVVCTSPCNVKVPAAARYRVAGSRPSEPFVLDARKGSASVTVEPATQRGFMTGVAVLGAGSALAIAGGIVLAVGTANQADVPGRDGSVTDTSFSDAMYVGTVMLISGLAGAIYGGANVLNNMKTTVSGNVVKAPPARGQAPAPSQAIMIPILGGTF